MPSVELPLFKHPVAGGGRFLSRMAITLIALFMAIGPYSASGADFKRLK